MNKKFKLVITYDAERGVAVRDGDLEKVFNKLRKHAEANQGLAHFRSANELFILYARLQHKRKKVSLSLFSKGIELKVNKEGRINLWPVEFGTAERLLLDLF